MRFSTLTTITVAVLASVSALPVDSVRDVSQTREDIPLSKRAEQLEPSAEAAPLVPGNGQNNGVGAASNGEYGDAPEAPGSLSKRNKKSKDATAGQKNDGGATKPDGTPQEPGSLSKRNKKEKDAASQKNDGGATNPDDAPQGTRSLSKRTKNEKDTAATGQKSGVTNDGNVVGTYQDPNALSKRAEALSGGTADGSGFQNTGASPNVDPSGNKGFADEK